MNIAIVVGATGLVGKKLVTLLAQDERIKKVITITRRPVTYRSPKVINEVINFEELEKHCDIFKGNVLFSCLGTTVKQAGTIAQQRKVDFEYQYQAAKIASQNNVNRYVLVSSVGANAHSKSAYLKMKGELENAVSLLPFKQISILQPSLLTGERDHFRLGETFANYLFPIVCKLPFLKRYRPISGDDVAKKMLSLGLSESDGKQVYKLDELFN